MSNKKITPLIERFQRYVQQKEQDYYDRIWREYILGITPSVKQEIKERYRKHFQRVKTRMRKPESKLIKEIESFFTNEPDPEHEKYLWDVDTGVKADLDVWSIYMIKELATQRPGYYLKILPRLRRRQIWVNDFRAVGLYPKRESSAEIILRLVPLAEAQLSEGYLIKMAREIAEKIRRETVARQVDSYGVRPEETAQQWNLLTHNRFEFDGYYVDNLLDQITTKLKNPEERRKVILSYFFMSGVSQLKFIKESIDADKPVRPSYREQLNRMAKTHWIRVLEHIREVEMKNEEEKRETFYGVSVAEVDTIINQINEYRVYSTVEMLRRGVLVQVPQWVFDGLAADIGEVVKQKDGPGQQQLTAYTAESRRRYDLFQKIVGANGEYLQDMAGILHQGFMREQNDKANVDADDKESYQESIMVDARLFDKEFNLATSSKLAQALAGKGFDEVNIFLGNLFWPGYETRPTKSLRSKLKMYHLKAVDDYLKGKIDLDEARKQVFEFYRFGKNLSPQEHLDEDLTSKINDEFDKIEVLKEKYTLLQDLEDKKTPLDSEEAVKIDHEIEVIKNSMAVIINPLMVPWDYLMLQAPKFGLRAQERKDWLISLQKSAVGLVGLLQNEHFFDDIQGDGANNKIAVLKLRKLLRYYDAILDIDESAPGSDGSTGHSFDWLAQHGDLLQQHWHVISEMINELGLDSSLKDVLDAGDIAAQRQVNRDKNGKLSDIINIPDKALLAKGGIDLTPAKMDLQIQNNGAVIKFHIDPEMLAQLQNATGFVPVIINIQPMTDLKKFLCSSLPAVK